MARNSLGFEKPPAESRPRAVSTALERFGRSSLFVYWIHVELVYGYATWPIHNRLPLWGALVACAAFSGLMYAAVVVKERIRQWHPATRSGRPSTGLKEAT